MTGIVESVLAGCVAFALYAYLGYPVLLAALGRRRNAERRAWPEQWPMVSILIPVHNAGATLRRTLESVLALDYPEERRQIVVVSDASTDATDEIARSIDGIELVRVPVRRGKTAAENQACRHLRGFIVVTVDGSVELSPQSLKALVAPFSDPAVGVTSGRDVSVARDPRARHSGESGYVGYEMWVRALETRVDGIVGASGCFYAERASLYERPVPEHLSRDFAAALVARERGYRAVSVRDAVCFVPRAGRLADEYRRKVRTVARGIATLWFKRNVLNPLRHPVFAWMLWSHKIARWVLPGFGVAALAALMILAPAHAWAAAVALIAGAATIAGGLGAAAIWNGTARPPRPVVWLAYGLTSNIAVLHAWINVARGRTAPIWGPTVRHRATVH